MALPVSESRHSRLQQGSLAPVSTSREAAAPAAPIAEQAAVFIDQQQQPVWFARLWPQRRRPAAARRYPQHWMARYGKVLLQRLTFQFCDRMGSSQGMRDYLQQHLPALAAQHPGVSLSTVLKRNCFPLVKAEYALLPNDMQHLEQQVLKQARVQAQQQQPGSSAPQQQRASRQQQQQQQQQQRLTSNVVGVKHRSADDIRQVVWWLCQSQNRPRTRGIPRKHIASKQPSIQGVWTASTF